MKERYEYHFHTKRLDTEVHLPGESAVCVTSLRGYLWGSRDVVSEWERVSLGRYHMGGGGDSPWEKSAIGTHLGFACCFHKKVKKKNYSPNFSVCHPRENCSSLKSNRF